MSSYGVWITIYVLLFAGGVYPALERESADTITNEILIENVSALKFDSYVGATHSIFLYASTSYSKEECTITSPNKGKLVLAEGFDHPKIHMIEGNDCGVTINVNSEDMGGDWILIGLYDFFDRKIERRLPFTISFEGVSPTTENEKEATESDGVTWLKQIQHVTRTSLNIDITLSRTGNDEECYVKPPNERFVKFGEAPITGVTFHSKSEYVSCRVTVGPMDDSLLGSWTLCGRYYEDEMQERCQKVNIAWNNNDDPNQRWHLTRQPEFDHPVNEGGMITPIVVGSGSILTCHIVTPRGEDLVLTSDSDYPGITRAALNTDGACSVAIGPIETSMLGSWEIYGKFWHTALGLNVVQLPMNLFLYDEDNPHAQAYNVTNENPINRFINLGSIITVEVTGTGNLDECVYRSPKGVFYGQNELNNFDGVVLVNEPNICRVSMGPVTEEMLGEWQIIGKFNNGIIFNERRQIFNVIQEDPENPFIDESRRVVTMTQQHFDTSIGSSLTITSTLNSFVTRQSCHVRTPAGLQYKIMDGFSLTGVEVIERANIECGLNVTVLSEDMVGEWTLISRVLSLGEPIERRLPFTVYVEEIVSALPEFITVAEGNSIHVRLRDPTPLYDTCELVGPNENERHYEVDTTYYESCGFIIQNAQQIDSGKWHIVYGNNVVYRATIEINIIERAQLNTEQLTFIKDTQVNLELGPDNAVYCKIENPAGLVVFDSFGKCNIVVERVTLEHAGYWKISVGLPGQVVVTEGKFFATVQEGESKAVVTSQVVKERPAVMLTCSVNSPHLVRACLFRSPMGEVRLAVQGVGESRYISQSSQVTYESDVHGHECGLRITEPTSEDLGLWRCAIETETETHYGFLTVLCPWLMQNPEIQESVVSEPVLTSERTSITSTEGDATMMSCSIQASIKYCYFRAQNGTIFSVTPATSSASMEYVGNGFDAGECGVRFHNLQHTDSGRWSCHVGFINDMDQEQRAQFQVTVEEQITARHYRDKHRGLLVEAVIHGSRQLEYCRFVRIDGLGFTNDRIPAGYNDLSSLQNGICLLQLEQATMLNLHPWTVVAKVRGQDVELSFATTDNLLEFEVESETASSATAFLAVTIILLGMTLLLLGLSLGPRKNRAWTYARASAMRSSIRNSMRKTKPNETV